MSRSYRKTLLSFVAVALAPLILMGSVLALFIYSNVTEELRKSNAGTLSQIAASGDIILGELDSTFLTLATNSELTFLLADVLKTGTTSYYDALLYRTMKAFLYSQTNSRDYIHSIYISIDDCARPQQLMAAEREIIEEAYAGDIIGVFDPGIFSIGDTLCAPSRKFCFDPIPTFAPEHFERIRSVDTMKRKQFLKGAEQIALEGAIQIFKLPYTGMEEVIVGVVGTLQFDVFQYRLKNEYKVDLVMDNLPYEYLRWVDAFDGNLDDDLVIGNGQDIKLVEDYQGSKLLLFSAPWSIKWVQDKNKDLTLTEFGGAKF